MLKSYTDRFVEIQNDLFGVVSNSKITITLQQRLREGISALSKLLMGQQQEIAGLKGKLEMTSTKIMPFAEIVRKQERERSRSLTRMRIRQEAPYVAIVLPKDETCTSIKTKKELQSAIDPMRLRVGVTNLRNIGRGGVIIETKKEEDLDKNLEDMKKLDALKDHFTAKKVETRVQ